MLSTFETVMSNLIVKLCNNGKGVFTESPIESQETLLEVTGVLMTPEEIESDGVFAPKSANAYRFSRELYMSPLGMSEFFNHSCNPNVFVSKENNRLYIKAIHEISAGTELCMDYSTIMAPDDKWTMKCNCGSGSCRGLIEKFVNLPESVQRKYIDAGIVPEYILEKN
jgi:uncharacterized protein